MARELEILTKEIILERLRQVKPQLALYGISQVGLFGSYVRGEQTDKSDVDILIDFQDFEHTTFDNFLKTYSKVKRLFVRRKVDVVTVNGLSKYIALHILEEVQYV